MRKKKVKCSLCGYKMLPISQRCPKCGMLYVSQDDRHLNMNKEADDSRREINGSNSIIGIPVNTDLNTFRNSRVEIEFPANKVFGTLKLDGRVYEVYIGHIDEEKMYADDGVVCSKHIFKLIER